MIIGLLKEIKPNEYRVAATPAAIGQIVARGHQVLVQAGAGVGSGFADSEYAAAGATILQTAEEVYTQADLFYKVKEMFPQEWKYMNRDKILYTYIHSNAHPEETDAILESKVTAIAYDGQTLTPIQYLEADTVGARGSADIHLSPDGKYLYASNRLKADGIAIFSVDGETGMLTKAGYQLTGIHPRNFIITPDGRFLLVACRDSNVVQIFSRDEKTGLLVDTGKRIETSKPVCLKFID